MARAPRIKLEDGLELTTMSLRSLKAAHWNPRQIDDAAFAGLGESLTRYGFAGVIVFNRRTKTVLGGHQRLRHLADAGRKQVPVIVGDWDEDAQIDLNILLNSPEIQGRFTPALDKLLEASRERSPEQFQAVRLDKLLSSVSVSGHRRKKKAGEDDRFDPEPPKTPTTKPGDLWRLGRHRLLCGDSTVDADVDRLLATQTPDMALCDPPYAIYGSSTGIASDITDDKMVRPFFEAIFGQVYRVLPWFAHNYIWCDWRTWPSIWHSAKRRGLVAKNAIIWDKGDSGLGSMWMLCWEMVGFFVKQRVTKTMKHAGRDHGQRLVNRPNILRAPRPHGADRQHNAAKPFAVIAELLGAGCDDGGSVLDLFGGSGPTMIVAERLDRSCFMMEIEPKWCDVIVERWQNETGKKAKR